MSIVQYLNQFYCRYDRFKNSGKDLDDSKKTTVCGKPDCDTVMSDKAELATEKKDTQTKDTTANTISTSTTTTSAALAAK